MKHVKLFEEFINESVINKQFSDVNFMKASRLINSIINKSTGNSYKIFPFVEMRNNVPSVMMYTDKDSSAICVSYSVSSPGIVGSLSYFSDFISNTADFEITSENFPIVKLIGEFVRLMNPKYLSTVISESFLLEGKRMAPLSKNDIDTILAELDKGHTAAQIAQDFGFPYRQILSVRKNPVIKETGSPTVNKNELTLNDKVAFIEETMDDLYQVSRKIAAGAFNSLFITGRAGTGKTYTVEKAMQDEGLVRDEDYVLITGSVSTVMMFIKLFQYREKTIIFDDADAVFRDENGRNILKAALDTKKVRRIAYIKKVKGLFDPTMYDDNPEGYGDAVENGEVPNQFDFTGRVIFISNLSKSIADPDGAIQSRSILIDINPDDATLMERMRRLLPYLEPIDMSIEDKEEIFEFMQNAKNISMRTFVKAAGFKKAGLGNWQRMAQRYV
jgi:hypothetical protein